MVGRARGQAAVESVGVTVAVALLIAALGLWVAGNVKPTGPPPDVISRVADALGPGSSGATQALTTDGLPRWLDTRAVGRGDRPIGWFLSRAGRGAVQAAGLAVSADLAWREGFAERAVARWDEFLRDPVGAAASLPDPEDLTPAHLARRVREAVGDLRDYGERVSGMPLRDAVTTVAWDVGGLSADVTIDIVEALAKRGVSRRLRRVLHGGDAQTP